MRAATRKMPKHTQALLSLLSGREQEPLRICEIGVFAGLNAYWLAKMLPQASLLLIDPYLACGNPALHGKLGLLNQTEFDGTLLTAVGALREFGARIQWLFCDDMSANGKLPPRLVFDFVFLDHLHDAATVQRSLPVWWDRLWSKGILAFHDYDGKLDRQGVWGVKQAVDAFAAERGLPVTVGTRGSLVASLKKQQ